MSESRNGIGDHPGHEIRVDGGYLEYRVAPCYMVEIVNIEVSNLHRREGKGREMVGQLINWCVSQKIKAIFVTTRISNKIAREFYESLGFRRVSTMSWFYPGPDAHAAIYLLSDISTHDRTMTGR